MHSNQNVHRFYIMYKDFTSRTHRVGAVATPLAARELCDEWAKAVVMQHFSVHPLQWLSMLLSQWTVELLLCISELWLQCSHAPSCQHHRLYYLSVHQSFERISSAQIASWERFSPAEDCSQFKRLRRTGTATVQSIELTSCSALPPPAGAFTPLPLRSGPNV